MDKLFLLKPDFTDNKIDPQERLYYCPDCAMIEGVLSYYPVLREKLEIIYVDFPKPRRPIMDWLGETHQSCPVLILDNAEAEYDFIQTANGKRFISSADQILMYLALTYQIGFPHP